MSSQEKIRNDRAVKMIAERNGSFATHHKDYRYARARGAQIEAYKKWQALKHLEPDSYA